MRIAADASGEVVVGKILRAWPVFRSTRRRVSRRSDRSGRAATLPRAARAAKAAPRAARPAAAPRPAARPFAAGKKRRGVNQDELNMVLEYIARNPGKRSEEIRKALGVPQDQNSKILAKLRDLKKVRTKGEKRTTSYFA